MSHREYTTKERVSLGQKFLERIGRPDLEKKLTLQTPYGYVCPEYMLDHINSNVANPHNAAAGHNGNGFKDNIYAVELAAHMTNSSVTALHHPDAAEIARNGGYAGGIDLINKDEPDALAAAGGLGALGGDTVLDASDTGIPFEGIGIYHTIRMHQTIGSVGEGNNLQIDIAKKAKTPEELGLKKVDGLSVAIATRNPDETEDVITHLDVYDLHVGGADSQTNIHLLYEPGLREVYPGRQEEDHRLYQMTALGFGAAQIWEQQGKTPSVLHMNESSTSLAAVGMWDRLLQKHLSEGISADTAFELSKQEMRSIDILTNHTLVPAAEATYTRAQYEKYVLPNIHNQQIKDRLLQLIDANGGCMPILNIGLYLTDPGRVNGVSQLHARLASDIFKKAYPDDSPVREGREPFVFAGETNAVNRRWNESIHKLYQREGVIDQFDLPTDDYTDRIEALDTGMLRREKARAKAELREFLKTRRLGNNEVDENSDPKVLDLPADATIIGWSRRMAGYKRPGMLLDDLDQLKLMLEKHPDAHVIYSGKAHPTDQPMKKELQHILHIIQYDPVLSKRVHYIQDYDIDVGRKLTAGADIWLNNPIVGREACGTSIFKAVKSNAILVSTPDGGAADVPNSDYMAIEGTNYREELDSMYGQLDRALMLVKSTDEEWGTYIKRQLTAFMPIVAGGRMIKDYLNFALPQAMPVVT